MVWCSGYGLELSMTFVLHTHNDRETALEVFGSNLVFFFFNLFCLFLVCLFFFRFRRGGGR